MLEKKGPKLRRTCPLDENDSIRCTQGRRYTLWHILPRLSPETKNNENTKEEEEAKNSDALFK